MTPKTVGSAERKQNEIVKLLLGLLWGRPQKSLLGSLSSDFEFFGVSGVLGGRDFLNSRAPPFWGELSSAEWARSTQLPVPPRLRG